ncbi:MAG: hypothetical protein ACH36H_04475, partial [Candidatus Nanopelagicales bacterium]
GICVVLIVLMLGGATIWALRDGWTPVSDVALLQLRLDRMIVDPAQVGVYSRYGWFHPGPAYLWFMWLPYELIGPAWLIVGAVVLQMGGLLLAWQFARRLSVTAGGIALVAALVVLWVRPADQAMLPWNPYMSIVGGLTVVLAAWNAAERRRLGAVLLLPLGSFLMQAHVGTASLVALTTLAALGLMLLPRSGARPPWVWWLIGAAMALVMWLPPLWDQLAGSHNLSALTKAMLGAGDTAGWGQALAAWSQAYGRSPSWLSFTGNLPTQAATPWLLLIPIAALLVAVVVRQGRGLHLRLLAILAAANLAAPLAVAGIQGPAMEYLVAWIPAVATATVAMSVWVLLDCVRGLDSTPQATVGALRLSMALGLASVVGAGAVAWTWAHAPLPFSSEGAAARHLSQALQVDASGQRAVIVRPESASDRLAAVEQGTLADAVAAGVDVAPDAVTAAWIGGGGADDPASRVRYTVVNWDPYFVTPPGQDLADIYDPFTREQWQRIREIDQRIAAAGDDQRQKYLLGLELAQVTGGQQAYGLVRLDPLQPAPAGN